jgi:hypothetical protein
MQLRLFGWVRLPGRLGPGRQRGSHRRSGAKGTGGYETGGRPVASPAPAAPAMLRPAANAAGRGRGPSAPATAGQPSVAGQASAGVAARAAIRTRDMVPAQRRAAPAVRPANAQPWYESRHASKAAAGTQDCGCLEPILHREWEAAIPVPAVVTAMKRLADLPQLIKEKLAAGLDAIHVGPGGVPDLDEMGALKGVLLPSGRATWDACAGAYGDRKIVVGSRPSPTPDVMCHEIGHALDDIDGHGGQWQSDAADFCRLYQRCLPRMASEFHRHGGALGRREFFADAFAAIASGQRPALVEMLAGDTRAALDVMLYFNVRYGI